MENNDILSKINHDSGMTVPDGYFADFNKRMEAALPTRPWENAPAKRERTLWQKVRPYAYMAAMFMGVWCMMKMVDIMRTGTDLSQSNINQDLVSAVANDTFYNSYCTPLMEEDDLYYDLYADGFDPENIDFGE